MATDKTNGVIVGMGASGPLAHIISDGQRYRG